MAISTGAPFGTGDHAAVADAYTHIHGGGHMLGTMTGIQGVPLALLLALFVVGGSSVLLLLQVYSV
jgi:hypothetical protein